MSKIAIISRPEQGILIDIAGCTTVQEAANHLGSTLQLSSQFWQGLPIDLNLGQLKLNASEVYELLNLAKKQGVELKEIHSDNPSTKVHLKEYAANILQEEGLSTELAISGEVGTTSIQPLDSQPVTEDQPAQGRDTTGTRIIMYEAENLTLPIQTEAAGKSDQRQAPASALKKSLDAVLYLKQTLRSGQAVTHNGHLVIVGDVNAGAEVRAQGDITIWGTLRGVAHAGIDGNCQAEIRALKLQPIQLRIADTIARSPDPPQALQGNDWGPESARLIEGKIRILRNALD